MQGKADYVGSPPSARLGELAARYTTQLHVFPSTATRALFLNTRVPPFDDLRVRRALNFALDRRELVRLSGGTDEVAGTCQILPPNFPGYRPYCPYTLNPGRSTWSAPDLATARRLITASGTTGMPVVVWYPAAIPVGEVFSRYAAKLLGRLGYRASLKAVSDPTGYFGEIGDSRTRAQIGFTGWSADYPAPSNFLNVLFSCQSFKPASTENLNVSGFCDADVDARIRKALRLQTLDPRAANAAWAQVDRAVVDRAPWVTATSPYDIGFVSRRVGNYQFSPQWGVLLDQLWVR